MENEKVIQMMLEAEEDRATLNVIKNIIVSDVVDHYTKFNAICAAIGIRKTDFEKSGAPL